MDEANDETYEISKPLVTTPKETVKVKSSRKKEVEGESNIRCRVCKRHFSTSDFYAHLSNVNYHYNKLLCGVCGKAFNSKFAMKYHIGTRHMIGDDTFECTVCKKRYPTPKYLTDHHKNNPSHASKARKRQM